MDFKQWPGYPCGKIISGLEKRRWDVENVQGYDQYRYTIIK
jgi:hypothetical protein